MTGVRTYVQELINQAIVSELEFPISWKIFQLQFPKLEELYLKNAEELERSLEYFEADGARILWLLQYSDMKFIIAAINKINKYFRRILRGEEVTVMELGADKDLLKAGITLEKSYGKDAGTGDNVIGKWTPITAGSPIDFTVGTYQQFTILQLGSSWMGGSVLSTNGNLFKFDGLAKVVTQDGAFHDQKTYYELRGDIYIPLEPGTDYQIGDIIADFGFTVYEDSVYDSDLNPSFADFVTGVPISPARESVIAQLKEEFLGGTFKAKYGKGSTFASQEPVVIQFRYDSYETIPYRFTYSNKSYTIEDGLYTFRGAVVENIDQLNRDGVALFQYEKNYDWEKDLAENKVITSNLHIRKLIKGWFGHGKYGWSRDINSLPYTQTLDEHEWANAYATNVETYCRQVRAIKADDLLGLVNGDQSKFYLLFMIANLYAVRHELLSIYFRALNEIRKKGVYRK